MFLATACCAFCCFGRGEKRYLRLMARSGVFAGRRWLCLEPRWLPAWTSGTRAIFRPARGRRGTCCSTLALELRRRFYCWRFTRGRGEDPGRRLVAGNVLPAAHGTWRERRSELRHYDAFLAGFKQQDQWTLTQIHIKKHGPVSDLVKYLELRADNGPSVHRVVLGDHPAARPCSRW